jgi:Fe-S oxidoreductase
MAKVKYDLPEFNGPLVDVPAIKPGATSEIRCHPASEEHLKAFGFPEKLPEDWKEKLLKRFGELLEKYKSLKLFLDICVKCGACTDKCHYYLGTADPNNMPVARQELLRKIYRRYFTPAGKYFGSLSRAEDLTEDTLKEWTAYFFQCSECRRCSVYCPFGIDTAEITMAARELLQSVGIGQKYALEIIGKVYTTGNNLGIPKPALIGTLEFLEEDVKEETGVDVKFPLDVKGAEVLLIVPSADFFSSPHIDSLIGYAKVFHEAEVSFTFSSYASEFANFGIFMGNYEMMRKVAQRIVDAARDLGVKRIVVGECGHAWRVAYSFWDTLNGPLDFLDPKYRYPQHICEFTLEQIRSGKVKFDKSRNDEHVVTFHDSCNVSRGSRMGDEPGSQFETPRELLKEVLNNYVEMDPRTNREETFCCGGGGGLLTDEVLEIRVKGAAPKVAALKDVMERKKVTAMAMICAICKAQFTKVLPEYDIDMEAVTGVHQFVSNAIVLTGEVRDDE